MATTVTILYKSGNKVHVKVDSLSIKRFMNGSKEVSWEKMRPNPLLIGVDDIEAVFEGKV